MKQKGRFITIEGQDGAGKSTNVAVIEAFLNENNIDYIQSREPGGTAFGETVRELILNSKDKSIGDLPELLLMFAARAQHIEQVILPALKQGKWVLCDRFTDASYAYQGGGRGLGFEVVAQLENLVQGSLRPDLTLLLDLPTELGEQRAGQRSQPDRFEQEAIDFKHLVRQSYLTLAASHSDRIKIIDASQSMDQVKQSIIACLSDFVRTQG